MASRRCQRTGWYLLSFLALRPMEFALGYTTRPTQFTMDAMTPNHPIHEPTLASRRLLARVIGTG
jgi:hypothetical protein